MFLILFKDILFILKLFFFYLFQCAMTSPTDAQYDSSIFTNYINISLSIDKLEGTNYDT